MEYKSNQSIISKLLGAHFRSGARSNLSFLPLFRRPWLAAMKNIMVDDINNTTQYASLYIGKYSRSA